MALCLNTNKGGNDTRGNEIVLYPNPSEGIVAIVMPNNKNESLLRIFNNVGEEVYQKHSFTDIDIIDVRNLSNGIYFVSVTYGDNHYVGKLVLTK